MTEAKKPAARKPAAKKCDCDHSHDDLEKRIAELELYREAVEHLSAALGQYPPSMLLEDLRKKRDA